MIQQLKDSVELKFGRKITYQKDCKDLSECILKETSQLISASTLRRFFGFLATNSNPSRVTLDILSAYCGYSCWDEFKLNCFEPTDYSESIAKTWETARLKANDISKKNIVQLEKNTLTKQLASINRSFFDVRFNNLYSSKENILPIVAPGGHGKTALLLNWYNAYHQHQKQRNDIVLLISATHLENWVGKELFLENWLLNLLNVPNSNLFNRIKEKPDALPGKFILVVNGLNKLIANSSKYDKILSSINEFIATFPENSLKIILTSRYHAWLQFTKVAPSLVNWCTKESSNFDRYGANIPKLSHLEIQQVLDASVNVKSQPRIVIEQLSYRLQQELKFPYSLGLFVNSCTEPSQNTIADWVDLNIEFIKKKIYQAQFSDEKVDILNAIVSISQKSSTNGTIKKNDLKQLYPIHLKLSGNYFTAYNQLVSFGIANEELTENDFGLYTKKITITHKPIFYILAAQKLISENGSIDFDLFKQVEKQYSNTEITRELIAVLFNLAYKKGQTEVLKAFFTLSEPTLKHAFANNEILHTINSNEQIRRELIPHFASNVAARKYLFEQFTDLNSLALASRLLAMSYLQHSNLDTEQLLAKTHLSLSDAYRLDFKWTDTFASKIEHKPPHKEFNAFTKGSWFTCKLLDSYICKKNNVLDILSEISSYTNENETTLSNRDEFELALVFGMLFSRQYKPEQKRLEHYMGERLAKPETPEENALTIYHAYSKWRATGEFDHTLMGKIEVILSNIPQWIQLQTVIIAKSFLAMYWFSNGNMDYAYSLYRHAVEVSSFAGYKVFEVKLLKNLSATLTTIGEHENADRCNQFVQSIAESCNIDFNLI